MKDMITRVREDKKGFTLAELLVVVAIIAVLVAIAIPVFTAQLAKAEAATDEANIRTGYASAQTMFITGTTTDYGTYYLQNDGSIIKDGIAGAYQTKGNSTDLGTAANIGGVTFTWTEGQLITYDLGVTDGKPTMTMDSEDGEQP